MDGSIAAIKSDVERLAKLVLPVAPVLAAVLGSPLASVGVSLLASLFGKNPTDLTGIIDTINSDSASLDKVKMMAIEHQDTLAKCSSSNYQTEVNDREDARKYGVEYKDFMRHIAYFVTGGFICALFLMFIPLQISSEEKQLLSMLVGMLASKWQTIIDYYFGSSTRYTQGVSQ